MRMRHIAPSAARLVAAGIFVLSLAPGVALAASADKEIATAAKHAGLAGNSQNIIGVRTHLHHAINCLEGPKGAAFDAKELNPCADLGNGAIPDTTDTATMATLRKADDLAVAGVAASDLAAAQKAARDTEAMLDQAMKK